MQREGGANEIYMRRGGQEPRPRGDLKSSRAAPNGNIPRCHVGHCHPRTLAARRDFWAPLARGLHDVQQLSRLASVSFRCRRQTLTCPCPFPFLRLVRPCSRFCVSGCMTAMAFVSPMGSPGEVLRRAVFVQRPVMPVRAAGQRMAAAARVRHAAARLVMSDTNPGPSQFADVDVLPPRKPTKHGTFVGVPTLPDGCGWDVGFV